MASWETAGTEWAAHPAHHGGTSVCGTQQAHRWGRTRPSIQACHACGVPLCKACVGKIILGTEINVCYQSIPTSSRELINCLSVYVNINLQGKLTSLLLCTLVLAGASGTVPFWYPQFWSGWQQPEQLTAWCRCVMELLNPVQEWRFASLIWEESLLKLMRQYTIIT